MYSHAFVQGNDDDDAASQASAGGGAAEMAMVVAAAEAEAEVVGSAETEENVQRILLAIDNFTRKVRLSYTPVPPESDQPVCL